MSIQKPYNINLSGQNYDAILPITVIWSISGAIQTSFAITVKNNSTNVTVWSLAQTSSYDTSYTIPANSLPNNLQLKIYIQVWDENDNTATSNAVVFATSATPVVTLDAISSPVAFSSYTFSATYYQNASVGMKNWIAYLYNSDQVLLKNSGIKTSSTIEYIFTGLETGNSYYVEFQATSSKNLVGTTGLVPFDVSFTTTSLDTTLTAENIDNAGIKLSMDVVRVLGVSYPSPPTYISGSKVDLTNNGSWVNFREGLLLNSSAFTLKIWLENPHITTDTYINEDDYLLYLSGTDERKMFLQYRSDHKFHLFKKVGTVYSHYVSNEVVGTSFFVGIQQISNNCNINAIVLS